MIGNKIKNNKSLYKAISRKPYKVRKRTGGFFFKKNHSFDAKLLRALYSLNLPNMIYNVNYKSLTV